MRFGRCRNTSQSQNTLKSSKNNPEKCLDAPRADTITKTRCLLDTNAIFHEKRRFRVRMKTYRFCIRYSSVDTCSRTLVFHFCNVLKYVYVIKKYFGRTLNLDGDSNVTHVTKNADFQFITTVIAIL